MFFDTAQIPFLYEPEGFKLSFDASQKDYSFTDSDDIEETLWYLPDFWLPQQDCYWEVKGVEPARMENIRAKRLAYGSGKDVFISFGDIWLPEEGTNTDYCSAHVFFGSGGWDLAYWWCQCDYCGKLQLQFEGRVERCSCKQTERRLKGGGTNSDRLVRAYKAARSARF